jgi:hypothetical protein
VAAGTWWSARTGPGLYYDAGFAGVEAGWALGVLDTASNTVVATVPTGLPFGSVRDIAINPAGTRVYLPFSTVGPYGHAGGGHRQQQRDCQRADRSAPRRRGGQSHRGLSAVRVQDRLGAGLWLQRRHRRISLGLPSDFSVWDIAVNPAGTRVYVTSFSETGVSRPDVSR